MGEYIDIGVQTPIFAYIILISSVAVGAVALLGFETENDDDDSDSGSGGLMQPIWLYQILFLFDFLINTLTILLILPRNKNIEHKSVKQIIKTFIISKE